MIIMHHCHKIKTYLYWKYIQTITLTFCFSVEPSVTRYDSPLSDPSTCKKQFVVCPIPLGRIFSRNIALITELLPLLVL